MKNWDGTLSKAQRQALETQLAHTPDAATYRRLWALLELDQGRSLAEVARLSYVDRRTVYRWIERFAAQGNPAALEHQPGQGRPAQWNEKLARLLESALEQPPIKLGYPANTWTAPLLHAFLNFYLPEQPVSISTVRRHLKDLGYGWKRFRYVLAPDPEAEKKTPPLAPDPGFALAYGPFGTGRNRPAALPTPAFGVGTSGATRHRAPLRL